MSELMWTLPETLKDLEGAGDGNIVRDLIHSFRHDTARRMQRIREALDRRDAVSIKAEAHSVSGAARQMGAPELAEVCSRIEVAPAGVEWPALAVQVQQAEVCFAEASAAMSGYLQE